MKILHYSLGLPPYRTGGLTKFATDLMEQQIREKMKYGIVNYEVVDMKSMLLDITSHK